MLGIRAVQHQNFWFIPQGIGKQKLIGLIMEELRFSYGCNKMWSNTGDQSLGHPEDEYLIEDFFVVQYLSKGY
jgi:hypothetical protein